MSEQCDRCKSVGDDRRTLWMACFYAMNELGLPFKTEILLDADPETLTKATDPVTFEPKSGAAIVLQAGSVRCSGELHPRQFYTLRVCKRCRAQWLAAIADWYQSAPAGEDHDADEHQPGVGSGIFIRENGAVREITREEWDRRHPGQEPAKVMLPECGGAGDA